ncbi:MAG: hypothetical protein J6V76_04180 [Bacteroidales bacterium]|nr:hypothetical protein [Bacteroidales bacterium]
MNNAEKKLFLSKLKTENDEQLLKTLDFFRNNGDTEVLPDVLRLLESDRSENVIETVLTLVGDLKNHAASDIAFDYMRQTGNADARRKMITALWQSDADFSHRADEIAGLILDSDDFETAFEVLTLFENNACNIQKEKAATLIQLFEQKAEGAGAGFEGIFNAAKQHLINTVNGETED